MHIRFNAKRNQVLYTIDNINADGMATVINQSGCLNKTKPIRGAPSITVAQTQIMVDLFKDQLVAIDILIEVSADMVNTGILIRQRFPQ